MDQTTVDRFWSKVDKMPGHGPQGECWLWTAGHMRGGRYGLFRLGSTLDGSRRQEGAHRISWQISHGPIPKGLCVCHRCDVMHCVRPDHLFLGTRAENSADMERKNRSTWGMRNAQARIPPEVVEAIRNAPFGVHETSRRFGVSPMHVSNIRNGRRRAKG